VGTRCRDCAQLKALPTYQVGPMHIVRASLAGLALALVGGIAWSIFQVGAFFLIWVLPFYGILAAEVVSRSANRKRGPVMAGIAVATIVLTYVVSRLLPVALVVLSSGGARLVRQANLLAVLFDPIAIVLVVVACVIAVSRLR
jgi:hypothetical protein